MKIAIVINQYPPESIGGTEIFTSKMVLELIDRGHEVHVITSVKRPTPDMHDGRGFIHYIPRSRFRLIQKMSFLLRIIRTIKEIEPEIMHAQSFTIGFPVYVAKLLQRRPFVIWGQGSDVYSPDMLTRITFRPVLRSADAALALTEDMRTKMLEYHKRTIYTLPNGTKVPPPIDAIHSVRKEGKRIVFIGRLHRIKGVKHLISTMTLLRKEIVDAELWLIGDGSEKEGLVSLSRELGLEDCVHFLGLMSNEEALREASKADVFVLPSLSEGFPISLLEAMSIGLPVVATSVGGIPDLIEDGVNGLLVESGNSEQLANAIITLLNNELLRESMRKNNFERAKEFDISKISDDLLSIYGDILGTDCPTKIKHQ